MKKIKVEKKIEVKDGKKKKEPTVTVELTHKEAITVEIMLQFHIGRCHSLSNNRKGQYAVDLINPYRLVFRKIGDEIQIAEIIEIVDYH